MMVRKCDRCGKEFKWKDTQYNIIVKKSELITEKYGSLECTTKQETVKNIDLCESCYTELNHFMLDYEVYNK